jgi:hypothetical protein
MSTPHDRAMDRCEAARANLKATREMTESLVAWAQAEVDAAEAELVAYEKQAGIPLPLVEQRRVEDRRWNEARAAELEEARSHALRNPPRWIREQQP